MIALIVNVYIKSIVVALRSVTECNLIFTLKRCGSFFQEKNRYN